MEDAQEDSFEENEREVLIRQQMEEVKIRYKNSFTKLKAMKAEIDHLHHLLDKTRVKMQREFDVWWDQQTKRDLSKPPSGRLRPPSSHSSVNGFGSGPPGISLPPNSIRVGEAWRTPPESPMRSPQKISQLSPMGSSNTIRKYSSDNRVRELDARNEYSKQGGDGIAPPRELQKPPSPAGNFHLPSSFSLRNSAVIGQSGFVANSSSHSAPPHQPNPTQNDSTVGQRSFSSGHHRVKTPADQRIPLTGDSNTDANILAFIKARESLMQKKS